MKLLGIRLSLLVVGVIAAAAPVGAGAAVHATLVNRSVIHATPPVQDNAPSIIG